MKLLSGNTISFEYDSNLAKITCNGSPFSKPFFNDQGMELVPGSVYAHAPRYKSPFPKQIILALGMGCNKNCSYCSQANINNKEDFPSDPDVLLAKILANKNMLRLTSRFVFWGGEPLLYMDKMQHIVHTLFNETNISRDVVFEIKTNGLLLNEKMSTFILGNHIRINLSHNGPWNEGKDCLQEGTDSYKFLSQVRPQDFYINSVLTRKGFNRADLLNHFFAVLPNIENPAIQSFQGFTLTKDNVDQCLYLENPLAAMVVAFEQYKNGLAEKFMDFWPIVQRLKYRLSMQDYPILESYNRFSYDCLNLDCLRIDLDGNIYSDHTFDNSPEKILGNISDLGNLLQTDNSNKFIASNELKNRCRGCPVLPLCLGGDLWTPKGLEEKECLQRFAFWAPIWTYIMNGYILETPITAIRESSFVHKDLYLDFLNSDVYQSAVRGE